MVVLFLQKISLPLLKNLLNNLLLLLIKICTFINSLFMYILLLVLGYLFLLFELNYDRVILIINLILNIILWRYHIKIFKLLFNFLNLNSLNFLPWSDLRNSQSRTSYQFVLALLYNLHIQSKISSILGINIKLRNNTFLCCFSLYYQLI